MVADSRYRLATRCLDLLEVSHLPQAKKLRLQVLLLKFKILLLKMEPKPALYKASSDEGPFLEVLLKIEQMCQNNSAEVVYHHVAEELDELVKELATCGLPQ